MFILDKEDSEIMKVTLVSPQMSQQRMTQFYQHYFAIKKNLLFRISLHKYKVMIY